VPRTVIVGDIHGCRAELEALLAHVAFDSSDRLVMVGDLVVHGPDPVGTLDLLISIGARSVRGNHEDRLLRWRDSPRKPLSLAHRAVTIKLASRHWAFLESLPLWLDLPDHGVRVVHAGLVPGIPIDKQAPRSLMYIRTLTATGRPLEEREGILWGEHYEGPPHIVFGHNALTDPQIHRDATGVDTGAVYGNRLTAMVLDAGAKPPPPEDRREVLVTVPSRRRYADG
jgi:hypothetical protein